MRKVTFELCAIDFFSNYNQSKIKNVLIRGLFYRAKTFLHSVFLQTETHRNSFVVAKFNDILQLCVMQLVAFFRARDAFVTEGNRARGAQFDKYRNSMPSTVVLHAITK